MIIFATALIAAGGYLVGSALPLLRHNLTHRALYRLMAFGASVLITTALIELIPNAMELAGRRVGLGMLAAFLLIFVLETITVPHSGHQIEHEERAHTLGLVAFISIGFHNFLDGLILAAGFVSSVALGAITLVAVLVHQLPVGLSVASILLGAGYSRERAWWLSLVLAAAVPLGTLLATTALTRMPDEAIGMMLGFAAGSFIHVGATDILPHVHEERDGVSIAVVLGGSGLMLMIFSFLDH
ncbi:MAG: ZIP family metal transporter [Ardenticatenaceae bacterium]|nr:ZIP family metal transporter [Ardenticatenaceae bacterium]